MSGKKVVKKLSKKHRPYALRISENVVSIDEASSVRQAANLLADKNIGAVCVKNGGKMVGILSERDIVFRVVAKGLDVSTTRVSDVMTRNVISADLSQGLGDVHKKMREIKFRHLPIVERGEVVGIVSNRDLMYLDRLKIESKKKK